MRANNHRSLEQLALTDFGHVEAAITEVALRNAGRGTMVDHEVVFFIRHFAGTYLLVRLKLLRAP